MKKAFIPFIAASMILGVALTACNSQNNTLDQPSSNFQTDVALNELEEIINTHSEELEFWQVVTNEPEQFYGINENFRPADSVIVEYSVIDNSVLINIEDTAKANRLFAQAYANGSVDHHKYRHAWIFHPEAEMDGLCEMVLLYGGKPLLKGTDISDAKLTYDNEIGSTVNLVFDGLGKARLAKMTKEHMNETIALVYKDQVLKTANVSAEITNGKVSIGINPTNPSFTRVTVSRPTNE